MNRLMQTTRVQADRLHIIYIKTRQLLSSPGIRPVQSGFCKIRDSWYRKTTVWSDPECANKNDPRNFYGALAESSLRF